MPETSVILASASAARARILRAAGLTIEIAPASIDEAGIRETMQGEAFPVSAIAQKLAELKALQISRVNPGRIVLGADQILCARGKIFAKARSIDEARNILRTLRGQTHELYTAVCAVRDGERLWHHLECPALTMRNFTDTFLSAYLGDSEDTALQNVGAYAVEGPGIQLFSQIQGDVFAIQGLPLLPVLEFLRSHEIIGS